MSNTLLPLILDTDSYKLSHFSQYPPGTTSMYSYLEARGGVYHSTVFFGLQYILKKYLSQRITVEHVEEANSFAIKHGVPFNYEGWMYIAQNLEGRLPVRIRAVPEGSVIPIGNVLMSVESTDPKVFWIVSYLETLLLRVWYPTTVATLSYRAKNLIRSYLEDTSDDPESELLFKLHDFGSRGVSSQESAAIGGAAHLVNFRGSDTLAGIHLANEFYHSGMAGFSICATEHSTMTMWGRYRETEAYDNLLDQYSDQPIFACVSDSYDVYNAVSNIWGGALRDRVINYNGTLVIRPDSGDPVEVCTRLIKTLDGVFGSEVNSKGYKVISHNVRIIQGDGVDLYSIEDILYTLESYGYSATNISFGMGGGLLQKVNRDTHQFAFKCSSATVEGKEVDVYKQPVTDQGKQSKRGRLELDLRDTGAFKTARRENSTCSILKDVYLNGSLRSNQILEDIRNMVDSYTD